MYTTICNRLRAAQRQFTQLVLIVTGLALSLATYTVTRWDRVRGSGDRGSESVEKAVLVAIGLAVAIGLGFAIKAAVEKYQGQIK